MKGSLEQEGYDVRFEWGTRGLHAVGRHAKVIVVVDVLSFTTAVDVASSRGAEVFPFRWKDERAEEFAMSVGATLAVRRREISAARPYSLSPRSLTTIPAGTRLVLPSPNGAVVVLEAAELGATVIAGCLRNASAVARAAREFATANGERRGLVVIAAGERWEDESLRPALEDLWGAGAILSGLSDLALSPEARAALACYRETTKEELIECASARELKEMGFADDVELALDVDVSSCVPVLRGRSFVIAGPDGERR